MLVFSVLGSCFALVLLAAQMTQGSKLKMIGSKKVEEGTRAADGRAVSWANTALRYFSCCSSTVPLQSAPSVLLRTRVITEQQMEEL